MVLSRTERVLAVAASGLLALGAVSTSYAAGRPARPVARVTLQGAVSTPTPAPPRPAAATGALPAEAAAPTPPLTGCPPPAQHPPSWTPRPLGPPAVADAALPATRRPGPKARDLSALTGKGIWVTDWPKDHVDVTGIVARAKAAGLTSIWVRTGGSRQGYYGGPVLAALGPAAHRAGLMVVAWDFPFLSDPVTDVVRAHRALNAGIDAFAPDVETAAEGTRASTRRISLYLSLVRSVAGGRPIAATVPRPTTTRLRTFPYAAFAPYADAFVPMVYWSCNEPGALVATSLRTLGRWLPVAPVGQAYDMTSDGGRAGLPSRAETWRFLDSARRGGALGASLWTIEAIGRGQWSALSGYPWPGR